MKTKPGPPNCREADLNLSAFAKKLQTKTIYCLIFVWLHDNINTKSNRADHKKKVFNG